MDVRLEQMDCLEGMQTLTSGTVDLVFADPPFNYGKPYEYHDDRMEDDRYLAWCKRWMAEVWRVLSDTGTFWLASPDEYVAELKVIAHRELGFHLRNWVIWHYTFGQNCKRKFNRAHTHLLYFVKDSKSFIFHGELIRIASARQSVYNDRRAAPAGKVPDDVWVLRPGREPDWFLPDGDVWHASRVCGTFKERIPEAVCQMPEAILERIIVACSNPGQTVLDPFVGSGTTVAVAARLGRKAIGFDTSGQCIEAARRRVAAVAPVV